MRKKSRSKSSATAMPSEIRNIPRATTRRHSAARVASDRTASASIARTAPGRIAAITAKRPGCGTKLPT